MARRGGILRSLAKSCKEKRKLVIRKNKAGMGPAFLFFPKKEGGKGVGAKE